jgi:hypothetical protein
MINRKDRSTSRGSRRQWGRDPKKNPEGHPGKTVKDLERKREEPISIA